MRTLVVCALVMLWVNAAIGAPPATTRDPVSDAYHGVTVSDDYRWLETWTDPAVQAWSEAQNAHARSVLDALPSVQAIRARVEELLSAPVDTYSDVTAVQGTIFARRRRPPAQQPCLITMDSLDGASAARVLVDPNKLSASGTASIDWYVPSPDGKLVAVSLSQGGSEQGDLHLFDARTGEEVEAPIERVQAGTAGGSLAWLDNRSYLYTRYPRKGERVGNDLHFYVRLHRHTVGEPSRNDPYELGADFPKISEIQVETDPVSGRALATVQLGDGGQFALYLRAKEGLWRKFAGFEDGVRQAIFGPRNDLYLLSFKDAPRGEVKRLVIDGSFGLDRADVIIGQGKDVVVTSFLSAPPSAAATRDRLVLTYQTGGPSELRAFTLDGKPAKAPEQLPVSTVSGVQAIGDGILFNNVSDTAPPAWYRFDPAAGTTTRTSLATQAAVNFEDCEVIREMATSKDGTKVPVNILRPRNAPRDGSGPLVLNGYGGYGVNITPGFTAIRRALLEQGVSYAVANIRGGGEFGEEWHLGGNLLAKQNVFDDFEAAAKHLIERQYTSSARLAIIGGSNGGLLMGATLTQHPLLAKAVVSSVGIYDMLRVELSPNGAFNVPEFGSVKDEAQFRALYAYSPYHKVRDGTRYPAVLFLTGANDPRVDPMHSRKMTARLQAANPEGTVLLRTSNDSGHGLDTSLSERIAQQTDIHAFLFQQLGVEYRPVR